MPTLELRILTSKMRNIAKFQERHNRLNENSVIQRDNKDNIFIVPFGMALRKVALDRLSPDNLNGA